MVYYGGPGDQGWKTFSGSLIDQGGPKVKHMVIDVDRCLKVAYSMSILAECPAYPLRRTTGVSQLNKAQPFASYLWSIR